MSTDWHIPHGSVVVDLGEELGVVAANDNGRVDVRRDEVQARVVHAAVSKVELDGF